MLSIEWNYVVTHSLGKPPPWQPIPFVFSCEYAEDIVNWPAPIYGIEEIPCGESILLVNGGNFLGKIKVPAGFRCTMPFKCRTYRWLPDTGKADSSFGCEKFNPFER